MIFSPSPASHGFREKCKWDLNSTIYINGLHRCYIIVSPSPPNGLKQSNGLADMWASRSKPKQGVGCTFNGRHSSSIFRLLPPALPGPPAPASCVLRRCFARLIAKRYPADGQAIPPLCTSCYSLLSVGPPRTRTSQVSHSSPFRLHCSLINSNVFGFSPAFRRLTRQFSSSELINEAILLPPFRKKIVTSN